MSTPPFLTRFNRKLAIPVVLAFALQGATLLIITRAATPTIAVEPEQGTLVSPATVGTVATASGGSYVKFTQSSSPVSSAKPCAGTAAPAQWKHVILLMFENKTYSSVIGSSSAPYITSLAQACGTYTTWKDADYKVDGTKEGSYYSKPNYATLTSGVSPSVHGLKDDTYSTTSSVDNIFNRLRLAGRDTKTYYSGSASSTPCTSSNFSGAYHDAMRYYTDLGAQSTDPTTFCNTHDVPLSTFMTDVNNGKLPAFSLVLPTNDQNMHNNTISSGDSWAQSFLVPLLDSAQYKSGDTAIFFLWDEDTPIPNVLIAPSIKPGSHPTAPSGSNPIGHFSANRTFQDMLGITPYLGDSGSAPSLIDYYNGK